MAVVSLYAFMLDGWEDVSTWGLDGHHYYAQLTPNGVDDADGPQVRIGPPTNVVAGVTELIHDISVAIDQPLDLVDEAMARGVAMARGERVVPVTPPWPAPL